MGHPNALDGATTPRETLYDGYVVNAIIDAAYASIDQKQWQPVTLPVWRGRESVESLAVIRDYDADHVLLKEERMMDGSTKLILRHKKTGQVIHKTA